MKRLALAAALLLAGCPALTPGGGFTREPEQLAELSPAAQKLVEDATRDIPPGALRDVHTHVLSLDTARNGGYVNPRMLSWAHPVDRIKMKVYLSAAGIDDVAQADAQYAERLARLVRAMPKHGKHYLLAFDQHYEPDGTLTREQSEFYVPNDYVWQLARQHPDLFIAAASVHPYRPDALQELDRAAARGVKLIKWLPNAQGMDASDPRLDAYYAKVREHGMTILTHVGEEQAVESEAGQALGNPLRFRRPLDQGVRIVMAHGGSLGNSVDLDDPAHPVVPSYTLVLRLLREPRYKNLLRADISAMTQVNRAPAPVLAFLAAEDVHGQLMNGSDYPIPAVNALIQLRQLARAGLIAETDIAPLQEIYGCNPLLFDFVLKRRLRSPATGKGFPLSVFTADLAADPA